MARGLRFGEEELGDMGRFNERYKGRVGANTHLAPTLPIVLFMLPIVLLLLLQSHVAGLCSMAPGTKYHHQLRLAQIRSSSLPSGRMTSRCSPLHCAFSPAYDTTIRYAAVDWARNMRTLPKSLVLQRISSPLLFVLSTTSLICALNSITALPKVSSLAHTLLGSALGLLLVFRTNAAYDRFWEARKSWSTVTSECRHLATLACTFMTPEQALPMLSLTAAFPVCLKNYLRGGSEDAQKRDVRRLQNLLLPEEAACLFSVENQPLYVLTRLRSLGQASSVAGVSEKEREIMFRSATVLGECLSTCERIFNTPIPLAYSRHTSRFLVLYVSTLPLALVGVFGLATIPVMAVVCWALFGILEIGNLIEEPFTATIGRRSFFALKRDKKLYVLPLTEVCRTIRKDIRAISSYQARGKEFNVPTILRKPSSSVVPPEGFRQMRQMAAEAAAAAKVAAAKKEAAANEAAAAGGQAYLETTFEKPKRSGL